MAKFKHNTCHRFSGYTVEYVPIAENTEPNKILSACKENVHAVNQQPNNHISV